MSKLSHFSRASEEGLAALAKWKTRWADRTLRVTVTPPPRTFAERRSVLQALKQRGPIEVFKAVPGQPQEYIAVTNDTDMANQLAKDAYFRYEVSTPEPTTALDSQDNQDLEEMLEIAKPRLWPAQSEGGSFEARKAPSRSQTFDIRCTHMSDYHHPRAIRADPYTHRWPADFQRQAKSFRTMALKESLPVNLASRGLAHWLWNPRLPSVDHRKFQRLAVRKSLPGYWTGLLVESDASDGLHDDTNEEVTQWPTSNTSEKDT